MIYDFELKNGKEKQIFPSPRQRKFLLSEGTLFKEYGSDYNGYGYTNKNRVWKLSLSQKRKYNKLSGVIKRQELLSEEEKLEKWATRLAKLTGIPVDAAIKIGEEKIEYKEQKVSEMKERQYPNFSKKRETLIRKMQRENPLRPIKDKDHGLNILKASDRHNNSDYEFMLDEGREKALIGEIDKSEVKTFARTNFKYSSF